MALWAPGPRLYLPPAPLTSVLCTDDYVNRKGIYYHGESDRLLFVGHPEFAIPGDNGTDKVPKCSPNQYRVFEVTLPDPNQFALPDPNVHNPSEERLLWAVVGVQVGRGLPLGVAVSGHPYFNAFLDAETLNKRTAPQKTDDRKMAAHDPKQTQLIILGCKPPLGEYWDAAPSCDQQNNNAGECFPIELKGKAIEDGDMMDIGWGAANWAKFNGNKSDLPLDIAESITVYPDYLKMAESPTGDECWFFARRECLYARHVFSRGGTESEKPPASSILPPNPEEETRLANFSTTPSGSLITTDGQLFNRPYWILRAQGMNNGMCWNNRVYVTVGDNTRGTTMSISVAQGEPKTYDSGNIKHYSRHCEEYKVSLILELCSVSLTQEIVSYLHTIHPDVLEQWEITVGGPTAGLEDKYRYINSHATRCPNANAVKPSKDPTSELKFWKLNFTERLSLDLSQFPLGRKFLQARGIGKAGKLRVRHPPAPKRKRPAKAVPTKRKRSA